jgi:hypothetical protein
MTRLLFPCLLFSTLLLSACVNRAPATPPLTQAQLNTSLTNSEARLADNLAQLCHKWETKQTFQNEQLQDIEKNQRQLSSKLALIEDKLNTPPSKTVVAGTTSSPTKAAACPPATQANGSNVNNIGNKLVVGRVEWLWIEAINRVYEARVDTGATTSSISAQEITPFEKDGKRWVRFKLAPDDSDDGFEIEAPLVRYVRIRQASSDQLDRRPVAALTVRLGKMTEVAEFTLTDRTQMTYPILLGRSFLRDVAVVDVAKNNVQPKPEVVAGQPQPKAVSKTKKQ